MISPCEIPQLDIPDVGRNHILLFLFYYFFQSVNHFSTRDLFRQLVCHLSLHSYILLDLNALQLELCTKCCWQAVAHSRSLLTAKVTSNIKNVLVSHPLFIATIYRLYYCSTITILHSYYNYTENVCQGSW